MKTILYPLLSTLIGVLRRRARLHLEIFVLRHQLAIVNDRGHKRVRLRRRERFFWVWLSRIWADCVETLAIFKPDTLVVDGWAWRARQARAHRGAQHRRQHPETAWD